MKVIPAVKLKQTGTILDSSDIQYVDITSVTKAMPLFHIVREKAMVSQFDQENHIVGQDKIIDSMVPDDGYLRSDIKQCIFEKHCGTSRVKMMLMI